MFFGPRWACQASSSRPGSPLPPPNAGEVRVVRVTISVPCPCSARQVLHFVLRSRLLGLHRVEQLLELCHVGLGHLRLHLAVRQTCEACVADHVARVARDHKAAGSWSGQLRREALRLHKSLVIDHDELALVSRRPVPDRAVVGHLQLAPARPVLRQEESSEKLEVLSR